MELIKNKKVEFSFKLLLAFFIPAITLFIVYGIFGMYPFGEKSVLIMDMSNQYVEFFSGLKSIFSGETTPFFSWHKSFGTNYIGVFAYYVSSPFSFLTLFFSNDLMPLALFFINILKVGLCGLTFYLFTREKFNFSFFISLIFSSIYALISYNIVYSMSLMWLDGVIWFPIILIGIERLIKSGKIYLLIVSFSILFISNYYISFMVALGAGIYFVLSYFTTQLQKPKYDFFKKIGKFILSGIIAACVCAFILIPTFLSLSEGKLASDLSQKDQLFNFDFLNIFQKMVPGVYDSITNSGLPNIFSSSFCFIGITLFLFNNKIKIKEKILSCSVLIFMLLSMWIMKIDFIWHVFQYPNWFPYRYSFVFSFFAIYITMRCFNRKNGIKKWHFLTTIALCILFVCTVTFLDFKYITSNLIINFSIILFLMILFLFLLLFFSHKKKKLLSFLLLFICVFELGYNALYCIKGLDKQFGYVDYNIYKDNYNIVSPLIDYAKQSENEFFRLEKTFKRSLNEPIAFGYNGIDHYSSAYNKNINTLTKKLGMAQAYFWNSYYGSTPVTDALFNVKYVINDKNAPSIFKEIKAENNYKLYKNDNVLGLCYLSSNDIKNFNFSSDFFQSQNDIINSILGDKNNTIFNTIDNNDIKQKLINVTASDSTYTKTSDDNKISYEFKAINNQPIYMDLSCGTSSKGYIYVNNKKIAQTFTNDDKNTAVYIGEFEKDENVIIDIVLKNNSVTFSDPQFYYFDTNSYKNAVNKIKQEGKVEEIFHDATSYKAKINLNKNKILMTSIPFSKSWNVYIDGKSVKPETFKNTFLYLNLSDFSSGEHEVYFKYIPQGFNIGLIISFITISFMVLYIIIKKKKINSNNK